MIGVSAVVAKQFGIVAAIVDGDVGVAVIVEVDGRQAASGDGANEIGTQNLRLFRTRPCPGCGTSAAALCIDFAVVELNIVQHGAVELQDVGPAVVVVIHKLHRDAA